MKSRAVVVTEPGRLEIREYPLPQIGPQDGILKVELAGVCGSDPGIFKGKSSRGERPYPIILGHEMVGRVFKMGKEAQKRHGVKEGDRVIIEYAFGCGMCRACLAGRYTLCQNFYNYGSMISCTDPPHLFGSYSDYVYIHPRAMVHKVGEDISPEAAVLICAVLGNGVRWLAHVGGVTVGQSVAIVGPGQQGLAGVMVASQAGACPIMVVGKSGDRKRLEMARRLGAHVIIDADQQDPVEEVSRATGGEMAQLVMDVTGHPGGAATALSLAGQGATLILPGIYGGQVEVPLILDQVVYKEIRLQGVYSHDFKAVEPAIALARSGRFPLEELISHRLPLEQAEQALKLVGGEMPGEMSLKVVLDPAL